ncbi:Amidohydrolase family protein [Pedobacter sp. ok626]|uniref:amidohydrolase family protein n=1 Tax=Pedobacter sp. ok626 TaxID=1761882 RepID=UPI00088E685A|nr:amidohydrolase family protein [Pedobacter sp. ok626]SDJ48767.1 Amidohydrolase family protein [Pedobacter sp. ok626]
MRISSTKPICIIGNVYDQNNDSCELKSIFINDGKVIKVIDGKADTSLIQNNFIIELANDEVILPALINLHTHIGYNILPIWNSPFVWNNRHQWRHHPKYYADIRDFVAFIKKDWANNINLVESFVAEYVDSKKMDSLFLESNASYLDIYKTLALTEIQRVHAILSEIQAVCGGTGLLLQTLSLDDEEPDMKRYLIRNTGNPEDLGIEKSLKVFPVVDFYTPDAILDGNANTDTSKWNPVAQKSLDQFTISVHQNNGQFYATIAHIGEGKTGNLYHSKKDAYSKTECLSLLETLVQKVNPDNLKSANLVLVHANGIDYKDKATVKFIKDNNISIVWSPVSNLLLYNDTLPIETLLAEQINVCLGTDWTPSGSKHILDEMKFAKYYSDKMNLGISSAEIFRMASTNAAKALGNLNYSEIKEGGCADLFVYKVADINNVADHVLANDDHKIRFSMINGRIVYGDTSVFDSMNVDYQKFPDSEGQYSKYKGISINSNLKFNLESAIQKMDTLIKSYSTNVLNEELQRTKFLSSDDKIYSDRISKLKQDL